MVWFLSPVCTLSILGSLVLYWTETSETYIITYHFLHFLVRTLSVSHCLYSPPRLAFELYKMAVHQLGPSHSLWIQWGVRGYSLADTGHWRHPPVLTTRYIVYDYHWNRWIERMVVTHGRLVFLLLPCQLGSVVQVSSFGLTKMITISPFFMLHNQTKVSNLHTSLLYL